MPRRMNLPVALPLIAAILGAAVLIGSPTRTAHAAVDYRVDPNAVCNWQYPSPGEMVWANSFRPWDPYSLFCQKWFLWDPLKSTALGGLDISRWCSARYPGSRSVVVRSGWYALDDWYCRR